MDIIYRDPEGLARNSGDDDFAHYLELMGSFVQPPVYAGILTPDFIAPDGSTLADGATPRFVSVAREVSNTQRTMPDGTSVQFWGFNHKEHSDYHFPSEPIRLVEGQIFHGFLHNTSIGSHHTIHWHGVEPTTQNDGVGKISMEVGSNGYEYQWQASSAGTHFYHCHRNTVLHFEMGMYGMLIVDPPPPNGPRDRHATLHDLGSVGYGYSAGGRGYVRRGNDVVPYDNEAIWVADDIDPVWHTYSHNEGLSSPGESGIPDARGNDLGVRFTSVPRSAPGLHDFDPQYFCISGVPNAWTTLDQFPQDALDSDGNLAYLPPVPAKVHAGGTLLVRLLCAAYSTNRFVFEGLDVEVIAMDGRPLGRSPNTRYSAPFRIAAGVPFELTTARRFDLLVRPTRRQLGSHRVLMEFKHPVTDHVLGIAETFIHVVRQPTTAGSGGPRPGSGGPPPGSGPIGGQ